MKEPLWALVVDDDVIVRQVTVRALLRENFKCAVASDGRKALEMLQQNVYDVAICDLHMPEMNGHALIVEMLKMERRPAIMVLTGVFEPRIARDLLARGVEDVVAKPAHNDFLVLKARAIVERRRSLFPPQLETSLPDCLPENSTQEESEEVVAQPPESYYAEFESASTTVAEHNIDNTRAVGTPIQKSNDSADSASDQAASELEKKCLGLDSIKRGMILLEDVRSKDGRLLVGNGTELTGHLIDRIRRFKGTCGVMEPLTVRTPVDCV